MGGSGAPPLGSGKRGKSNDDSGTGAGNGGGGGGSSDDDCIIQFVARIHGPVPGLADLLRVGDVLDVVRIEGPPIQLGLFNKSNQQVGALAGQRELTRVLNCIENGNSYVAEVQSSSGSMIAVSVRNT